MSSSLGRLGGAAAAAAAFLAALELGADFTGTALTLAAATDSPGRCLG